VKSRATRPKRPPRSGLPLDADQTPLRLPLGSDAVDAVLGHLDAAAADVTAWADLTRRAALNTGTDTVAQDVS